MSPGCRQQGTTFSRRAGPHPLAFSLAVALVLTSGLQSLTAPLPRLAAATEANRAADESDLAGTYSGDGLTVEINREGDECRGTLALGGQTFPFTARPKGAGWEGKFKADETEFVFTFALAGSQMKLETDGTQYTLQRKPPTARAANPLAKAVSSSPTAPMSTNSNPTTSTNMVPNQPTGGPTEGSAWKVFKHPTGVSMSYPPTWQLRDLTGALQLIPPDAASNADGPTEAYIVSAQAAEGITSAEDPRVINYLDLQMRQLAPFLQRTGQGEKVKAGTVPGVLLTWDGSNPRGLEVRAQTYAIVLKGYGIGVTALGGKNEIARREKIVRGVFASLAAGEGEKDPQLVGAWRFWSYTSSKIVSSGTEQTRLLVLRADGTCLWSSQTESSTQVSGKDYLGNETYWGGVAGTSSDRDRGTWTAGAGRLYVTWQNGSLSEWGYRMIGTPGARRLYLQGNSPKPDEWMEVP